MKMQAKPELEDTRARVAIFLSVYFHQNLSPIRSFFYNPT